MTDLTDLFVQDYYCPGFMEAGTWAYGGLDPQKGAASPSRMQDVELMISEDLSLKGLRICSAPRIVEWDSRGLVLAWRIENIPDLDRGGLIEMSPPPARGNEDGARD